MIVSCRNLFLSLNIKEVVYSTLIAKLVKKREIHSILPHKLEIYLSKLFKLSCEMAGSELTISQLQIQSIKKYSVAPSLYLIHRLACACLCSKVQNIPHTLKTPFLILSRSYGASYKFNSIFYAAVKRRCDFRILPMNLGEVNESSTTTSCPDSTSLRAVPEPIKPAPPVISIFTISPPQPTVGYQSFNKSQSIPYHLH